jgi:hypothetical protein
LLHLLVVAMHAIFSSPKFPGSSMMGRLLHLLSSTWLPLPYLTRRGVDRGEEMPQQWFLTGLHAVENFLILLISRAYYLHQRYPLPILALDLSILACNLLGICLSLLYHRRLELYAGLPSAPPPGLPSFRPEVSGPSPARSAQEIDWTRPGDPNEEQKITVLSTKSGKEEEAPVPARRRSRWRRFPSPTPA